MKKMVVILCLSLCIFSCNKCKDIACFSPPEAFFFKVLDKSGKNIASSFTSAVFKYEENGLAKEIILVKTLTNNQETVFSSNEIGWVSAGTNNEIAFDLLLDEKPSGKLICSVISKNEQCCSFFETTKLTFNEANLLGKKDIDYSYLLVVR